MKKILLASSALMLTAGFASAAELSFSGNARFGLGYSEDVANSGAEETRVEQRVRFQVRGTATTDAGVEFSARIRAEAGEDANSAISGGGFGAAEFSVSTGGFNLYVGNTSNVIDSGDAFDLYGYGVGFTAIVEHNANFAAPADGFSSGSDAETTIKVDYTAGDFVALASYQEDKVANTDEFQIGFGYNFGAVSAGIAYSTTSPATGSDMDYTILGVNGEAGAIKYAAIVADGDAIDDTAFGASIDYALSSATSIRAVVSTGGASANETSYGLGFRHGLGGGVTLAGGVGSNASDATVADLGVSFSF